MAFIRTVGCSVGQGVCHACDTDFTAMQKELGGGLFEVDELKSWAYPCEHICLTGGEPLDRDLRQLLLRLTVGQTMCHIETSGTKKPDWLDGVIRHQTNKPGRHMVAFDAVRDEDGTYSWCDMPLWVTVSPKPGYLPVMIAIADEVKVIVGGLGDGPGWPTVDDAARWAGEGKLVYVQPRNDRLDINRANMDEALEVVARYPQLRLSTQLHKYIRTR